MQFCLHFDQKHIIVCQGKFLTLPEAFVIYIKMYHTVRVNILFTNTIAKCMVLFGI